MSLAQLTAALRHQGVRQLFAKRLSPNDNSKNQIYLGGDFRVINVIPTEPPEATTSGTHDTPIFKAPLRLSWLTASGEVCPAPEARLILYPQYPEVRLSGFLKGAALSPNDLLAGRAVGRVLLLGVTVDRRVIGHAVPEDSAIARELAALHSLDEVGVLMRVPLDSGTSLADSRGRLLSALCRISREGWIQGWRLTKAGERIPCVARNCVGVTLESELGITANGRSEPDFDGWEVKAHTVASFDREGTGAVTLMTPEPNGGAYSVLEPIEFLQRFGYADKRGRDDRINFGGIHRTGIRCAATGLTMRMDGYDAPSGKITRSDGAVVLLTDDGEVAASWTFAGLLSHWTRKHSRAVFVPAIKRDTPDIGYRYGEKVLLAEGTDYALAMRAIADGSIYYDPGIKVEDVSTSPKVKKRSQFRVARGRLSGLYHSSTSVHSCA